MSTKSSPRGSANATSSPSAQPRSAQLVAALLEVEAGLAALATTVRALAIGAADPGQTPEPWVTLAAAAEHASCSVDVLRDLVRRGLLPAGRIGERAVRVRRSDVDRLLLAGGEPDGAPGESADEAPQTVARILRGLNP